MIDDARTVAWKEWKEWLSRPRGHGWRGWLWGSGNIVWRNLVFIPIIAVVMPLGEGRDWFEGPLPLIIWAFLTIIPAAVLTADSFAGERERRTLEPLLATRLSDRGILLGKLAAAVSFAWLSALCVPVIGLFVANLVDWTGTFTNYSATVWVTGLLGSALIGTLVSSIGVRVSLRAATVQEATVTITFPLLLLGLIPTLVLALLPRDAVRGTLDALQSADPAVAAGIAMAVLVALDAIFLWAAFQRFQRHRLVAA